MKYRGLQSKLESKEDFQEFNSQNEGDFIFALDPQESETTEICSDAQNMLNTSMETCGSVNTTYA